MSEPIVYRCGGHLPREQVLALYRANGWSSAEKPDQLMASLAGSHSVVTAWCGDCLVGLANALSDGHLVVYYSHLLVHPDYQGRGIGRSLVERLMARYAGFHQHVLLADGRAVDFYRKLGFTRAGSTEPMWIYAGKDHETDQGSGPSPGWVLFDWGDTLMVVFPEYTGPMATWPRVEVVAHARETLEQVRALGWQTALATNAPDSGEPQIRAALARAGLDSLIDRVFSSQDIGHSKPSPEFFAHIQADLGPDASQLVMVGDDFAKDIEGANRCGIRAVWFRPGCKPGTDHETRIIGDLLELPGLLHAWHPVTGSP